MLYLFAADMEEYKVEIDAIYKKYFHEVFLYVRILSGNNASLAEEITQETFVRAIKYIEKFDESANIRAWLFTVARNMYFHECRKKQIYADVDSLDRIPDTSLQILDRMVEAETVQNLENTVDALPEVYKEVFRLRIYGELTFEKIGNVYGKSAGWARVTYHRAKQMIREMCREEN